MKRYFPDWLALFALGFLIGFALTASAPWSLSAKERRHRVIEFEDEVVEGMNKRPLDSLSEISERERKKARPHLYKRRAGFRQETQLTLQEMRYSS